MVKDSVGKTLSLSAEQFGRGTTLLCCVQKLPGSEKVLEKKEEYQKVSWKVFCLTVPKNLVREQRFCAVFQRISGSEKV